MNTTAITRQAPQHLSLGAHIAGACAAVAMIAAGVAFAGSASGHAVQTAQAAMNPAIRYIVLPSVEVVAKRQAADVADATGCSAPVAKI